MKLLLDECVDQRFRKHIPGHDVFTVRYMGWSSVKNGALLGLAAENGFDALITTDQGIPHQHNPLALQLSIVCLRVEANDLNALVAMVPALIAELIKQPPRSMMTLDGS